MAHPEGGSCGLRRCGADGPVRMAGTVFVTLPLTIPFLVDPRTFIESFMDAGLEG